jgi:hypothetical protein
MPSPAPSVQQVQVSLVYVACCLANGKQYVGVTSRGLRERKRKHVARALAGSELCFHRALRKHGPENFSWRTESSGLLWADACEREQALIAELGTTSRARDYNVTDGGDGALGMSLPEEARLRVSATLKAKYATPEGQTLKARLSAVRTGTRASLQTRMKLAALRRGRTLSPESRAKLSASKLLYPEDLRSVSVRLAEEFGYRAVSRLFGIPRPTIRRWAKDPEALEEERRVMRERHRARQYGYAFPAHTQIQMQYPDETQM